MFTLLTSNNTCCPRERVVDSSRKGRTLSPHQQQQQQRRRRRERRTNVTANTSANVNVVVVVVAVKNRNRRKTRRGEEALKLECSRCVFNHHHHRMGGVFAGASSSSFTSLASSSGRNEDDESDEKKEEEEEEEGNISSSSSSSSSDSDKSSKEENKKQEKKDILVQLSLSLIDFYRNELSPFMPKSCRFIPSCSNYAFEAYTKYGAGKGFILTAWRIARCNPFGGRGYDPPRWPPSFTRGGDGE